MSSLSLPHPSLTRAKQRTHRTEAMNKGIEDVMMYLLGNMVGIASMVLDDMTYTQDVVE